jgi:hypothetical protein
MPADLSRLRFLWLFASLPGLTLPAQTLRLSSVTASRGARASIEISLASPKGKEPAALQWEVTIPTAELSLTDKGMAVGPAAQAAGKTITCAVKEKTGDTLTFICVLAGGQGQIRDGVIALLRLRVLPQAPIGPARIRVERGMAVSKETIQVPMNPVETVATIRAR